MINIKKIRQKRGLSQRQLAKLSGLSFRTIQLLESGEHNASIETLEKVSLALGYQEGEFELNLEELFTYSPFSIRNLSKRILADENTWKLELGNFIDEFRREPRCALIDAPPVAASKNKFKNLLASVVEVLCKESDLFIPDWCKETGFLKQPWFVADVENLKPMALVESPIEFRQRKIFVLENFMERR